MSSLTPSIKALKFNLIGDAQEKRDVAIVNFYAQFFQTEIDEGIHLKVCSTLVFVVVKYDHGTLKKHLRKENGRPTIYVLCNKVIDDTLNAAILVRKKLIKYLLIGDLRRIRMSYMRGTRVLKRIGLYLSSTRMLII